MEFFLLFCLGMVLGLVGFYARIFVHEIGHAIAVLAVGWKITEFNIDSPFSGSVHYLMWPTTARWKQIVITLAGYGAELAVFPALACIFYGSCSVVAATAFVLSIFGFVSFCGGYKAKGHDLNTALSLTFPKYSV